MAIPTRLPPLRPGLAWMLVVVCVCMAHAPALEGPLLWDDRALVPAASSPFPTVGELFGRPFWQATADAEAYRLFYRPLTTLTYWVDVAVHGDNPLGLHLTNLVLHLGVVGATFALARHWGAARGAALLAALAVGVFPRLTECVSWISGRTDVLAALLGLLALRVHGFAEDGGAARVVPQVGPRLGSDAPGPLPPGPLRAWSAQLSAGVLLLLSLLSKEVALAFVVVLGIRMWRYVGARRRAGGMVVLIAVVVGYGALRHQALSGMPPAETGYGVPRGVAFLEAVGRYAAMLLVGVPSRTQIGSLAVANFRWVAIGAVVCAGIAVLLLREAARIRRTRLASSSGTFGWPSGAEGFVLAAAALLPVLHVVPLSVNVAVADRFLYVPVVGLSLAVACRVLILSQRATSWALAVSLSICGVYGVGTFLRAADYRSEVTFWAKAVLSATPDNPIPREQLGNALYRCGELDAAYEHYRIAFELSPSRRAYGNLANVLSQMGRYEEALALRAEQLTRFPAAPARHGLNLALTYLHMGDLARAQAALSEVLSAEPKWSEAQEVRRLIDEVAAETAAVAELAPGPTREFRLARLLQRRGAKREAVDAFVRVLDRPDIDAAERDESLAFLVLAAPLEVLEAVVARRGLSDGSLQWQLAERHTCAAAIRPYVAALRAVAPRSP